MNLTTDRNTGLTVPVSTVQRLANVRHVALDMDGTLYSGQTVFPCTTPFLKLLDDLKIGFTFLTNNPSKSVADLLAHLARLGIKATPDQIYSSTHATIEYLQRNAPDVRQLFVVGTPGLCEELKDRGFTIHSESSTIEPDAVLVAFDTTLTYTRLCKAAWWIKQGRPYFATNPDFVCPTDQPTVLVDCGSLCAALEKATGRLPDKVFGKPSPVMLENILQRYSLQPENLAMVGDRLYTDVEMARRAKAIGVLVLTGEATMADVNASTLKPDLVVPSLAEFGDLLRQNCFSSTR